MRSSCYAKRRGGNEVLGNSAFSDSKCNWVDWLLEILCWNSRNITLYPNKKLHASITTRDKRV